MLQNIEGRNLKFNFCIFLFIYNKVYFLYTSQEVIQVVT